MDVETYTDYYVLNRKETDHYIYLLNW
jgi:hypothetical protein